jgi:putative ABC transport system substrate-binding protein
MRSLLKSALIATVLLSFVARAEQPLTAARIGVLTPSGDNSAEDGLREGLSELGYVEGKNLTIEWRRYEQSSEAMRSAAADLRRSSVDLIVAVGTQAARAALSETSTIPIVFVSGDPVGSGLAASLAHPGANATGLSSQTTHLMAKRFQLLQQIAPRARRVIMLVNPEGPLHTAVLREAQKAARALRMNIVALNARNTEELDTVLRTIQRTPDAALIVSSDVFFIANRDKISNAVRNAKLPTLVPNKDYWGEGVLMAYGSGLKELDHRAAVYIDKILRGAKPADLPIEQGSIRLVIDMRVARELGLKVPQDLLYRADEVIQ